MPLHLIRPNEAAKLIAASRISLAPMLGLPDNIKACLFDLDGVLTQTAKVHAAAWKEMFDDFLKARAEREGEEFVPFDSHDDYNRYVDGLPRYDGVRTFLESRDIHLDEGEPDAEPASETIRGLGNRKNELVLKLINEKGVDPYEGSVRYVDAVREAGLKSAVVSSSTNCKDVLAAAGMGDLFTTIVDGNVSDEQDLTGKPAPDTYLYGAKELGVDAADAAVFEDALGGVEAGRAGSFGVTVGVNRVGQAGALREHGADIVVDDLEELMDDA